MEILKKTVRQAAISNSVKSIREVLEEFLDRSEDDLEDFYGKFDELVLTQAVKVLRQRKACVAPETIEEFNNLIELIKSLEEVREYANKDILCRTAHPGK